MSAKPETRADAVLGFDADVAVVGLGAIGASAAWRLAARGVDVIGIEQPRGGAEGDDPFGSSPRPQRRGPSRASDPRV